MTIRKLQKSDAALAAELIKQFTQNIIEPENLAGRLENLAQAENCQYFVAEEGAGLVGFAGLVWYVIPSKGLMGWVEEVVVEQTRRNQGIGARLLEVILRLAKAKGLVQLKLTTANPAARHLYEKLGFNRKTEDLLVKKF